MADDVRISAWDLRASAGTTVELQFTSSDALTSLAVYTGGTVTDVDDLTGATAYTGTLSGGNLVATVDVVVPTGSSTPLRLVVNGVVQTVGRLIPATSGVAAPDNTITLSPGTYDFDLTILGMVGSGGGGGSDDQTAAEVPFTPTGTIAATNVQTAIAEVASEAAAAVAALSTVYQPLDSDLTAVAGLSPSNDDLLQRKAGAWTNRTPVQVKTDLALTKGDVGLGNVDNTSDAAKPVSTATQTALDAKAPLASPSFTGNPTAPTPTQGDNDTSIATTAFVKAATDALSGTYATEATRTASGKGFVNHGATASTARPSGYASVEWFGSVEPTNAIDGDTWVQTS